MHTSHCYDFPRVPDQMESDGLLGTRLCDLMWAELLLTVVGCRVERASSIWH